MHRDEINEWQFSEMAQLLPGQQMFTEMKIVAIRERERSVVNSDENGNWKKRTGDECLSKPGLPVSEVMRPAANQRNPAERHGDDDGCGQGNPWRAADGPAVNYQRRW